MRLPRKDLVAPPDIILAPVPRTPRSPQQSLALNYPLASSRCQSTSLTTQLLAGIRCLDLRFSLLKDKRGSGGTLWAYHGPVPQGREMRQVLEEVDRFLESEAGRSETVLISIKQVRSLPSYSRELPSLIDFSADRRTPRQGSLRRCGTSSTRCNPPTRNDGGTTGTSGPHWGMSAGAASCSAGSGSRAGVRFPFLVPVLFSPLDPRTDERDVLAGFCRRSAPPDLAGRPPLRLADRDRRARHARARLGEERVPLPPQNPALQKAIRD